ncbi:FMN-binding negative transcriptional regulator [Aquitalea sp. LB_tupeE]|uniref:FMN-binding negative transcriptional regulator n=1 Tax=Aquitalea sp. LB_tupeE TaxID=2748078 RepID=UPI0015BD66C1|nr:FMN-binding negative transcriptional regulator [Aquitalea sp. LB_tupeE]NWK78815.1 FMN-binding negative transcriptional regulator [Aquitalea sp. LB_tupeE]
MYIPNHFKQENVEEMHSCIINNPLGILITNTKNGLIANHIPFLIDAKENKLGTLRAHISIKNELHQAIENDDDVLVIFSSGNAYISPNWYPTKWVNHKQVPTWNYIVVHARGKIKFLRNEKEIRGIVGRLTKQLEADKPNPWKMSDAPRDYLDDLLKRIVGIEIEITELIGKNKLGQDEVINDIEGAANALLSQNNSTIGNAMLSLIDENKDNQL